MIGDYEFTALYDLYDEKTDENGETQYRLTKRNCKRKWYTSDLLNITDIREIPNRSGIPYKSKCEVYHRFENRWITIQGNYKELIDIFKLNDRSKIKGFK